MVAFSHAGDRLASASRDNSVMVWRLDTMRADMGITGHSEAVQYVAWSPSDTMLISCGADGDNTARVWDSQSGQCLLVISRHTLGVTSAAWLPSGATFITASTDQVWMNRVLGDAAVDSHHHTYLDYYTMDAQRVRGEGMAESARR